MSHVIKCIPIQARIHRDARQILARDRARAQKFLAGLHPHGPRASHARKSHQQLNGKAQHFSEFAAVPPAGDATAAHNSIDVTDAAVTYTLPVEVGQETFTLLIDTGSSNTWVGAHKKYKPTSTSRNTGKAVTVTYGSGSFSGTEYTDQVGLGGNLILKNQSIGVASKATGFHGGIDGILGIGPVDLTTGTVKGTQSVPTVTDSLFSQGLIPTDSIAISFNPTTSSGEDANGELTFGTTDTSKFNGSINYVPITATSPASHYWGIDQTLTYGSNTPLLQGAAGIVDTGTTLILIASDAFQAYQDATQATLDQTTGLLTITDDQFAQLESLFFQIGSETYELTPNAQIWPRQSNSSIGGQDDQIYLIVSDLGSNSGRGLDFINGFGFLQRHYSVYDTTNSRVGLATTPNTTAETN